MPTNAQLTEERDTAIAARNEIEERLDKVTAELATAKERGDQEAAARLAAEKRADVADGEIAELKSSLRAYKGSATKARNEVIVLKAELSPEARVIGAMRPPRSDEEALARQNALDQAFADGPMTIVFSDGKRELRELAPLIADGSAWLVTPRGRVLDHEPILEPGDCPRGELPIAGFALLDADGQQVAYSPLPERIIVASGTRVQIPRGSIRF